MKYLIAIFSSLILMHFSSSAQEITDSVSMGGGYTNDVFYSMANGEVENVSNSNWTVAFSTGSQTSQILINGGKGARLWQTNVDTGSFDQPLDTSGLNTWQELYDIDSTWSHSAFEFNRTGHPDYGWGNYNNNNHTIFGDVVFLIKTLDENYYKTWIVKKELGEITMRYASLDNSFDTTVAYQASDLPNKYFVYYDMDESLFNDREPANTNWDILFTRYYPSEFWGTGQIATGVLNSVHTEVAEVKFISNANATRYDGTFSPNKNIIGYDWKVLDLVSFDFDMVEDLTYFVKTSNDDIYKLYFTRFDGTSTGVAEFNKEFIANVTSIDENNDNLALYSLYPNPANNNVNLVFNSEDMSEALLSIYSIDGKKVLNQQLNVTEGLNSLSISLNDFEMGSYIVQLSNGSNVLKEKLMVTK